jgi:hypothetical protein
MFSKTLQPILSIPILGREPLGFHCILFDYVHVEIKHGEVLILEDWT